MSVLLKLNVRTRTALHIGSHSNDPMVGTNFFRQRADGKLVVPGTSIAGALRSHLTRIAPSMTRLETEEYNLKTVCDALQNDAPDQVCGCIVCRLMGDIYPDGDACASRLVIHDALLLKADRTHIRDGVGINRVSGAADREARSKFTMETVPAGTQFEIEMELEDVPGLEGELNRRLLALVLDEWQQGRILLGGRSNRGLGALAIDPITTWDALDFQRDLAALMALVRGENLYAEQAKTFIEVWHPQRAYHTHYDPVEYGVASWFEVKFELQAQGFFLTNDATAAQDQNIGHISLVGMVPGASVRGVLRSQAERIARTIANLSSRDAAEFLERCPAANPLAQWDGNGVRPDLESGASRVLNLDLNEIDLSEEEKQQPPREWFDLADRLFGNTYYGSRLVVEDLSLIGAAVWKPLDFLAVDRFTGGGADGLKFDALALWKPRFKGRLYLEAPADWELGWLLYTLKDMIDGRLTLGFGAAKGFGQVRLETVEFALGRAYPAALSLPVDWPSVEDNFFEIQRAAGWNDIPVACFEQWGAAWRNVVDQYRVEPLIAYEPDTDYYWCSSDDIHRLYRKEIDLDGR